MLVQTFAALALGCGETAETSTNASGDEEGYILAEGLDENLNEIRRENRPYRDGEPATIVSHRPDGVSTVVTGRHLQDARCQLEKAQFDEERRLIENRSYIPTELKQSVIESGERIVQIYCEEMSGEGE